MLIHDIDGELANLGEMKASQFSSFTAVGADVTPALPADPHLKLTGYSCSSITTVGSFRLTHGANGEGDPIITQVELEVDGSKSQWFGECGISCPDGVSIDRIVGTPNIFLYYKSQDL